VVGSETWVSIFGMAKVWRSPDFEDEGLARSVASAVLVPCVVGAPPRSVVVAAKAVPVPRAPMALMPTTAAVVFRIRRPDMFIEVPLLW
jgi:hypothetical protein